MSNKDNNEWENIFSNDLRDSYRKDLYGTKSQVLEKDHDDQIFHNPIDIKKLFSESYYTNPINKLIDVKKIFGGLTEKDLCLAISNVLCKNNLSCDFTAADKFLANYQTPEQKILAIKIALNLINPENKFDMKTRAYILEKLGFSPSEIKTIQKFESYSFLLGQKNLEDIEQEKFIFDSKDYFALVAQKIGLSENDVKECLNVISDSLLDNLRMSWNFGTVAMFYVQVANLYSCHVFDTKKIFDKKSFCDGVFVAKKIIYGNWQNLWGQRGSMPN